MMPWRGQGWRRGVVFALVKAVSIDVSGAAASAPPPGAAGPQ
ncbi:MAG: hypothetical protein R2708_12595 [Vicinamibacterales bacterium]